MSVTSDKEVTLGHLEKFPLAEYAARNWVEHARSESVARKMQEGLKRLFDERNTHFWVWVWVHDPKAPWRQTRRSVRGLVDPGEAPADMKALDTGIRTPLHRASERRHVGVARVLVGHGADTNASDKDSRTSLRRGTEEGHLDVSRVVFGHGAHVMAQDKYFWMPLDRGSSRGDVKIAGVLLEYGADTNARVGKGQAPLQLSSRARHLELV